MNRPVSDPLGAAITRALNDLAEASVSQDLPAAYALIGIHLADAGRQAAEKARVKAIARECVNDVVRSQTAWDEVVESATTRALSRLHLEGRRADADDLRAAMHEEAQHVKAQLNQAAKKASAPYIRIKP